jgi:surface polysaccharide O-acyltransferase-like enzyme
MNFYELRCPLCLLFSLTFLIYENKQINKRMNTLLCVCERRIYSIYLQHLNYSLQVKIYDYNCKLIAMIKCEWVVCVSVRELLEYRNL